MLSYRHAFHAGNHADILKHLTLMLVLQKLAQKDKAFCYLDTHSGRGQYDLNSDEALKTAEAEDGIIKLAKQKNVSHFALQDYLTLLAPYLSKGQYPGSPSIARRFMRAQDSMHLVELHNNEFALLARQFCKDKAVSVHHRDGFEALVALTPPTPKRGLVLIDPAYEVASDYDTVLKSVDKALKKWATGMYLIWYPLLSQRPDNKEQSTKVGMSERLLEKLQRLPVKNLLKAQLSVQDPASGGMYGSGMAVLNAPWQLDENLKDALTELVDKVALQGRGQFSVNWLIQPE